MQHLHDCKQVIVPDCLRQVEILQNKYTFTTGADWAARKGHLLMLQWLLKNTGEGCTTYAMDFAARNGHIDIMMWLHHNRSEGCTNAAANWAAFKGRLNIVKWLYKNTQSRCGELATVTAAGNGDLDMLCWLHAEGAITNTTCADMAFACGHEECLRFLESVGYKSCMSKDDKRLMERMQRHIEFRRLPFVQWD